MTGDARWPSLATGGLLKYPGVPVVATGTLLGGANKTIAAILAGGGETAANEILTLLNNAILRVYSTQTNSIFRPTHILLPLTEYGLLTTFRIPNTAETLISYLERVLKITIEPILQAATAGVGGVNRMMVYTKNAQFAKFHLGSPLTMGRFLLPNIDLLAGLYPPPSISYGSLVLEGDQATPDNLGIDNVLVWSDE